jgi:DNA-binding SARP family transcriptional activator
MRLKTGEIKSPRYDRFLVPLEIRLLGYPQIKIDGKQQPSPKGRKVWGLLAYLILTDRHPARSWLAGVLFGDADDPLGALRWSLAELRRLLGDGVALGGDPVVLTLPPETFVDVTASAPFEPGRELIEGADFGSSPGFDAWLMAERRRLAAQSIATARQNVMTMLAVGELEAAIRLATRLVEVDLLDEGAHALLIRCLMASGDRAGANGQFESARQILWRELGVEPGPELVAHSRKSCS